MVRFILFIGLDGKIKEGVSSPIWCDLYDYLAGVGGWGYGVSSPIWCDLYKGQKGREKAKIKVSSPIWCDLYICRVINMIMLLLCF
jgi:hypothetical protein